MGNDARMAATVSETVETGFGVTGEVPLARHFAEFLCRLAGRGDPSLAAAANAVVVAAAAGASCVDLRQLAGSASGATKVPPLAEWLTALRASPVIGRPGDWQPLILDDDARLYLHRYWDYERRLAADLRRRAAAVAEGVDDGVLRAGLGRLFPAPGEAIDWQKVAAANAVLRRLCVISGGPGTGKTTTVARILALLIEQAGERPPSIALAAPTGKAAARLQETLRRVKAMLDVSEPVRAAIPETATTLHRLLGAARFRHDRDNPLPLDVLVVDEVSMVDLAMMARLVDAMPPAARLILLGDKDQLAAVEPGAVLGDLCARGNAFTPGWAQRLAAVAGTPSLPTATDGAPLADAIVLLRHSHRFAASSGIGRFADAVRAGDADAALTLLGDAGPDLEWTASGESAPGEVDEPGASALAAYFDVVNGGKPDEAFAAYNRFRVLCAHRHGSGGVLAVNAGIERWLRNRGLVRGHATHYPGQPLLVTRNDHGLRLYNGDLGIVMPAADGGLRVMFATDAGGVRALSPARLPPHETAWALTVHKAQGSEFDEVLLRLPASASPVLCRELVYTAVTRARRRASVQGSREVVGAAVRQRHERTSGLRAALWPAVPDTGP